MKPRTLVSPAESTPMTTPWAIVVPGGGPLVPPSNTTAPIVTTISPMSDAMKMFRVVRSTGQASVPVLPGA